MPRLLPFPGVRYAAPGGHLDALVAPPYDVIDGAQRARLVARSRHNAVELELPLDEGGRDRYQVAAERWRRWREVGVLADDPQPSLYVYAMGYHDEDGRPRQTLGVLGALELSPPHEGQILPHEHTTPKDKADRFDLLRACRANLSPIWALSPAAGLSDLLAPSGPPVARATDEDGVHHRLWRITAPAVMEAITELVGRAPILVADGHHRFETALAYQAERRAATGGAAGAYDAVLACVVELAEDQLSVGPIHRLLSGLPAAFDLPGAMAAHFDVEPVDGPPAALPATMTGRGGLGLVTPTGAFVLRPTAATDEAAGLDLDSCRLDVALAELPPHGLAFEHGLDAALAAVAGGRAGAAVLLRPVTVAQIAETGRGGARMPPKTTFFTPKLRTGMVFRAVPG